MSDEVLVWLSVWRDVQIVCIWSSWRHCHPKTPLSLVSFKSRLLLPFWYRLNQVVLQKRPLNGCSSSNSSSSLHVADFVRSDAHSPAFLAPVTPSAATSPPLGYESAPNAWYQSSAHSLPPFHPAVGLHPRPWRRGRSSLRSSSLHCHIIIACRSFARSQSFVNIICSSIFPVRRRRALGAEEPAAALCSFPAPGLTSLSLYDFCSDIRRLQFVRELKTVLFARGYSSQAPLRTLVQKVNVKYVVPLRGL